MSTTLSVNPSAVSLGWNYVSTGFPNNTQDVNTVTYSGPSLTNGTGTGNANKKFSNQYSITASGTTTINLSSLTDPFGNSLSFAHIKALYVENSSLGTSTSITVGNAGANPFLGIWSAGTITINNGACMFHGVAQDATGYVVGTGVNILITNVDSAHAATVNVVIIGT